MNITSIIDNGYSLILEQDANTNVIIPKAFIKLELVGNIVRLYDASTSNQANQFAQAQQYNLDFNKITVPLSASAKILEANISTFINTLPPAPPPPPPFDYSTATNQTVQIIQVDDSTPELSSFKDANASVFKEWATATKISAFIDENSGKSWLRNLFYLRPFNKQLILQIFRPANVTPYTIGDAINSAVPVVMKLANAGDAEGTVNLVSINVRCTTNKALKPIFNYFFFKAPPPVQVDNAPINVSDILLTNDFIGSCSGSTMVSQVTPTTAGNFVQQLTLNLPLGMQTQNIQGDIWVIIGLANAYVPFASETFTFEFKFNNN